MTLEAIAPLSDDPTRQPSGDRQLTCPALAGERGAPPPTTPRQGDTIDCGCSRVAWLAADQRRKQFLCLIDSRAGRFLGPPFAGMSAGLVKLSPSGWLVSAS
jgi:hypothetical protein